ncbi:MAG: hypothetical protein KGL34_02390 [Gammaproteobacteria bacterium]|nr:hypothetical protein [Gammaproteobacteria bacterium]
MKVTNNWVIAQLRGLPARAPGVFDERRGPDRRQRRLWALLYGGFRPRRRGARRREDEARGVVTDWHEPHLLLVAIAILLLCTCDGVLTLILLNSGAREANPIMALLLARDARLFAVGKTLLTASGVVLLVASARRRMLRSLRVEYALYAILIGYASLIGYEWWLVRRVGILALY